MFTLAHLSDPHLAPLPKPRVAELIGKRLTGYINWRRNRQFVHDPAILERVIADLKAMKADHIAVTGDLVNISLTAEFARARAWLEQLGPSDAVTVVPGNHDAYVAAAAHAPENYWSPYMAGDGRDGASAGFPFVRRRGPVALIGVSTAVPTAPFMATGRVGTAQLARLGDILGRHGLAAPAPFRVVLIHHPPVSQASWHKRLTDRDAFRQIVAKSGAELVIHGHDHLRMLNWLDGPDGPVPAIGVPTASSALEAEAKCAGYNLYRIEDDGDGWKCTVETRALRAYGFESTTSLEYRMRKPRY